MSVCLLMCEWRSTVQQTARALLHGTGHNRWYDKTMQFIVFENGKAGFLGEVCPSVCVVAVFSAMCQGVWPLSVCCVSAISSVSLSLLGTALHV